jgi:hypothetical protein
MTREGEGKRERERERLGGEGEEGQTREGRSDISDSEAFAEASIQTYGE